MGVIIYVCLILLTGKLVRDESIGSTKEEGRASAKASHFALYMFAEKKGWNIWANRRLCPLLFFFGSLKA